MIPYSSLRTSTALARYVESLEKRGETLNYGTIRSEWEAAQWRVFWIKSVLIGILAFIFAILLPHEWWVILIVYGIITFYRFTDTIERVFI